MHVHRYGGLDNAQSSNLQQKPPKWMAPNPGVKSRAARDIELEDIPKATLDQAMAKANEKSKRLYNTLKGKDGGLSEAQLENMLFDVRPASLYHIVRKTRGRVAQTDSSTDI